MSVAHIALGSNLGDRAGNLRRALALLAAEPGIAVMRCSGFHETPAEHCPPGSPPFLNAAARLETSLGPRELLGRLLGVEATLGRRRAGDVRNAPRTLDLDLLLYDDAVIDEPGLVVPHPRLHERRFVLAPLGEIAPELGHPTLGKSVRALLESLGARRAPSTRGREPRSGTVARRV